MGRGIQLFRGIVIAILVTLIFLPILVAIFVIMITASIPSAIGRRMTVEAWLREGIDRVFNVERMRDCREDLYNRYSTSAKVSEEVERWNLIREMERSLDRTRQWLRSGGIVLTVFLGSLSIIMGATGQPLIAAVLLLLFGFIFSTIILLRIVIIDILSYDSKMFMEMSTNEIAMRMAWNKGPMSGNSAILLAVLTLFVGLGRDYQIGLDIAETLVMESKTDSKWRSKTQE